MSEDQDLPARPALSGRRERARLLGEDGPPTWDEDGAGQAVPGDRPPEAAPGPITPGHLPRRVPGSAAGGRTAPPGVRPAEPVRLPRPADGAPSRGAFEPPPKSGEPAGPPDGEPLPSGTTRQLPELKPASDSWSGAFQPTSRPPGGPVGTVLADDPPPGTRPAVQPSPAPPSAPGWVSSPAPPPAPFAGPTRQASPASSPSGLVPPAAPGSDQAVGGGRTGAPAPSRFGQAPGGLRTDGAAALDPASRPSPAGSPMAPGSRPFPADSPMAPASRRSAAEPALAPADRPSLADSAMARASRRSLAESALAPADRLIPADPPLAPASRRSAAESALARPSQRTPVPAGLPGAASEASSTGPQPRSAGTRPGAAGARPPARSPKAEPSWGSVLASTMRLWAQRRGRRWRATATAVLVLVVAAAGVTAGAVWMTSRHRATAGPSSSASPTVGHSPAPGTGAVSAAVSVRQAAAHWVTKQVNRAAIVACDPAMCALLHNSGFPAANLVPVLPDTTDPLGADLVMATAVVRNQFGRRLARVYAPLAIARFGTGNRRIDVRQVLPAGSPGARAQLAAKLREARQSGRQLLANRQIRVSGQARRILSQGHVDERLLATLAALASQQPIDVLGFGDANPGAGKWVPLRSADLAAADPTHGMSARSYRRALTSFLRAQRGSLYRATSVTLRTTQAGIRVIRIAFAAPSP